MIRTWMSLAGAGIAAGSVLVGTLLPEGTGGDGVLVAVLGTALVTGLLARSVAERIFAPLERLRNETSRMQAGRPPRPLPPTTGPFRDLAACFNATISALDAERNRHETSDGLFRAIFETSVDGVVVIDEQGRIQHLNPSCARTFGVRAEEVTGRNVKVLMPPEYQREHDGYLAAYRETGRRRIIGIGREVEGRRSDGSTFPIELSVAEVDLGARRLFAGILRDVSERRHAERRIDRVLEDLRQSHAELQRFAYIACHDLKSPLRGIDNLAAWIREDLGPRVDPETAGRLDLLRQRVRRMEKLLDTLLDYAGLGGEETSRLPSPAAALVAEAAALLTLPPGRSLVTDPALDRVVVPRMPLARVFHALIDNAVKHGAGGAGRISVGYRTRPGLHEFIVSDDGPGIDPAFHARIFEICQTLRPRDEVEGSGMGLPVVRKLLQRDGGRIWVESHPGRGAHFHVEWPARSGKEEKGHEPRGAEHPAGRG